MIFKILCEYLNSRLSNKNKSASTYSKEYLNLLTFKLNISLIKVILLHPLIRFAFFPIFYKVFSNLLFNMNIHALELILQSRWRVNELLDGFFHSFTLLKGFFNRLENLKKRRRKENEHLLKKIQVIYSWILAPF